MKKVLALLTIALCVGTAAMAQGGPQMTPEERKAQMIERLKPLNLTAVQQDSVLVIAADARSKMPSRDGGLDREAMMAKMKEVNDARNARLEKALGADLSKKVIEAISQRPGGGGRPGGGK